MAKDFWDKFKITSEALKNNWPMLLLGATAISSGLTNLNQYFVGQEDDFMKSAMKDQITVLAETYVKPKTITIKQSCGSCSGYFKQAIDQHKDELH